MENFPILQEFVPIRAAAQKSGWREKWGRRDRGKRKFNHWSLRPGWLALGPGWLAEMPGWLALRFDRLAVRPCWLAWRPCWLAWRPGCLTRRPGCLTRRPGWLMQRPGWLALGPWEWMDGRMDRQKISLFCRTLSPIRTASQKGFQNHVKHGIEYMQIYLLCFMMRWPILWFQLIILCCIVNIRLWA